VSFFKANDMRGVFGKDFDLDTVWRVGRWLPSVLGVKRVLVGRDARLTSEAVRDALCRGLAESGCAVDDMGLATTPMVYFFTAQMGYEASVQITASHNPPDCNGMKVSVAGAVPVGYDTGLGELEARVRSGELPDDGGGSRGRSPSSEVRQVAYRDAFVAWLRERKGDLSGLRFAVDCSDGMAGLVIRDVLGDAPLYLNETPDGNFPHHAPNPLEVENCEQLMAAVKAGGLDLGVIFDGDGDRVMFVDETGAFVQPDFLIPVIARPFLRREPGATVIYDIRMSRGAIETLEEDGAKTGMWKDVEGGPCVREDADARVGRGVRRRTGGALLLPRFLLLRLGRTCGAHRAGGGGGGEAARRDVQPDDAADHALRELGRDEFRGAGEGRGDGRSGTHGAGGVRRAVGGV